LIASYLSESKLVHEANAQQHITVYNNFFMTLSLFLTVYTIRM
jgi:hypothetical protein